MTMLSKTRPASASERRWFDDTVLLAMSLCRTSMAGMSLVEDAELRMYDVRGMPPDAEAELSALCRRTLEADVLTVFTGEVVHFYVGVPVRTDDGRPAGVVFVADPKFREFGDGERDALCAIGRQIERELDSWRHAKGCELVNRVASSAHRATTLHAALQSCLDEVCEYAGSPVGHAYVPAGDDSGELVSSGLWHCPDEDRFRLLRDVTEATRLSAGAGLAGEAAVQMGPKWMDDLSVRRGYAGEDLGVNSGFAFPVYVDHRLAAVLEFLHVDLRPPSPLLLEVVAELGRELGMAAARIGDRVELIRSQHALRGTVQQLRQIIGTAHDAFVALDEDGVVTEWNAAAVDMFGWSRQEILGRPLVDTAVPERFREAHRAGILRLKKTGGPADFAQLSELSALHRDGREFPISLVVWEPQSTGPYRFNAFIRDVSELKRAERASHDAHLREQDVVDELRRLDGIKTDFIANVSHELRTPLTSISGYLELLVEGAAGELSGEQSDMTSIVQRNTLRLLRLVEDILTVGKIDSGHFRPELVLTELGPLVTAAVQSVRPAAAAKSLTMELTCGPAPVVVRADPDQLDRALLNLVTNAVKFTSPGGSVLVDVQRHGGEVRITVADDGIGIPENELPLLFSRFFRSSLAVQHEIQGTGLGLAIVKHIVEHHSGRISVCSRPGEGTTVTMVLPVA
jgi:PAS domain S-box-containing protein